MSNTPTTPIPTKTELSKIGVMCRVVYNQDPTNPLSEILGTIGQNLANLSRADLNYFADLLKDSEHLGEVSTEIKRRQADNDEVESVEIPYKGEEAAVPEQVDLDAVEFADLDTPVKPTTEALSTMEDNDDELDIDFPEIPVAETIAVLPIIPDAPAPAPAAELTAIPVSEAEKPFEDSIPISSKVSESATPVVTDNDEFADMLSDMTNFSVNGNRTALDINEGILSSKKRLRATQEVILNGSFYSAQVSGFNLATRDAIRNSNLSDRAFMDKILNVMFDHIEIIKPFKPNFADWKRLTALSDLDSLYWAAYASTYRTGNELKLVCANPKGNMTDAKKPCRNEIDVEFEPKELIRFEDARTVTRINDVMASYATADGLNVDGIVANSLLGMRFNLLLPESKLLIVSKMPSLEDHLESMDVSPSDNSTESIKEIAPFIESVAMFNPEESRAKGSACFDKIPEARDYNILLNELSDSDFEHWEKKLEEFVSPFKVSFKTPDYICPSCGHTSPGVELNMTTMVFRRLTGG